MKKGIFLILILSIKIINSQTITTVAGNGLPGYSGDGGAAITAHIYGPKGLTVDGAGNIYIADQANQRIRKVNASGIITTIAGNGTGGYSGDGGPAIAAQLNNPWGVAVDASGNVYVGDYNNHCVRKINSLGIISTIAGTGTLGFSGDGAAANLAQLNNPTGVTLDPSGNIYIADTHNHRVRMINTLGIISTFAGNGIAGYGGDTSPATAAQMNEPSGLASDLSGNIFIADASNNVIRKVNTMGIILTIGGTGNAGFNGDGSNAVLAELNGVIDVAVDQNANIYVADLYNQRIRKISNSGIITTIAGNGIQGFSGDGGISTSAQLDLPSGLALDAAGNIYIADQANNRIREVFSMVGIEELSSSGKINIYPVPSTGFISVELNGNGYSSVTIKDVLGKEVYTRRIDAGQENIKIRINVGDVPNGIYFIELNNAKGKLVKKFAKE